MIQSAYELLAFDVERYQRALEQSHRDDPSPRVLFTPRQARDFEARVAEVLDRGASVEFRYHGQFEPMRLALRRALVAAGLEAPEVRAVEREIRQLARFFGGVLGESRPHVELCFASEIPRRPRDAPTFSLVCPLLGRARVHGCSEALAHESSEPLPARSALFCRGDASALAVAAPRVRDLWLVVSSTRTPFFLEPAPAPAPIETCDVLLVTMPFAPLGQASLALSLLDGTLDGVSSEILYLTLPLAQRIGPPLYAWFSDSQPFEESLSGEWIFSRALFGERPDAEARYLTEVLDDVPACEIEDIVHARTKVEAFMDECVASVLARAPKLIGFTSVFNQQVSSLALARRIKALRPEVVIVFGGANCEGAMGLEVVRSFEFVDAAVSGEGERVFAPLVASVLAGRGIPALQGVYTRKSALLVSGAPSNAPMVEAMDELPRPDFSDFFAQWQRTPAMRAYEPCLMFETSRGCWWGAKHHCTFCGLNGQGMAYRSKSGERALDELVDLVTRYPGCSVSVVDNILDMKYFKTLIPELSRRELPDLKLFYETKANLRRDQLRAMREAGIVFIQPGVESFSDSTLRLMRKGVDGVQNIQLLKWCLEFGIWPFWNIIWGFPGESPEDYEEVAALLPSLHHLPPPKAFGSLRLDRFSPNFEDHENMGFCDVRPFPAYQLVYDVPSRAVTNLAYYFRYKYQDGRDPTTYTRAMRDGLVAWQEKFEKSHLVYIDKGQDLVLWDNREVARRRFTVLGGAERALYLACDQAMSAAQLSAHLAKLGWTLEPGEIDEMTRPLVRDRLMIRAGAQFLSLAIPHEAALATHQHMRDAATT